MIWTSHFSHNRHWLYWKARWSGCQCLSLLTDKQFTTVPTIPLMLKGFLGMKVAFHFITLALHLVVLNACALLCSFPSSHLFMWMCPFSTLSRRPLWLLTHLSMLVCCGHTQEHMVSLLPTVFVCSTNANVKPRCLTENPLDDVKMHYEQNHLYPFIAED